MQPDPYTSYLEQASELFAQGEVVKAGQIWQAILKQQPGHAEARRRLLDVKDHLQRLQREEAATAPIPAEMEPAPEAVDGPEPSQLLTDGCTLYDMGQTEDALHKWEQALALDPSLTLARTYAEGARRELGLRGSEEPSVLPPVTHLPPPPAPGPIASQALDQKLRQADRLLAAGHPEEAAYAFQQALSLDPGNLVALSGLEHCRRPAQPPQTQIHLAPPAQIHLAPAPQPAPLALVSREIHPVQAPAALLQPPPPTREGLVLPHPLREPLREATERLPWLREPRVLAMLAGGAAVLLIAMTLLHSYRKERALRAEVKAALASALAPVAQRARAVDLAESPAAIQQEAELTLVTDPLRAFFRAETLATRTPGDAGAAELAERARRGLASGGSGVTLAEFQQHLQRGNLEAAAKAIDALLRAEPKDPDLRARAARLHLTLCAAHAAQAKWDEAHEDLLRGRALAPEDRSWQARVHLLEHLRTLPKAQQAPWIALLG